jgi:indolepyruvate ferredoxin oxidoreductase
VAQAQAALKPVGLDDKYRLEEGRVFATGIQALVRLPMEQRRRDLAAGLNTAGYISGYRGSPLGTYDQQLARARALLAAHHVVAEPAINEDLAATAIWGTQQAELDGMGRYDGVFGIWYGKGPGVDRSGDAIKHANLAGSSRHGGVVALLGDDHTCESSTTAHQSEFAMVDAMVPVLNPAGVQEILDYGLYGFALSRFAGGWAALKCMHDTVEATATIRVGAERARIVLPEDFLLPPGGLGIRWPDTPLAQEERLHVWKLEAAKAFLRANRLDRLVLGRGDAPLAVVTTGKSYLEVAEALDDLGIDAAEADRLGVRVYKVAMTWPLEPRGLEEALEGAARVLVVEEKRALIEPQVRDVLYGRQGAPLVVGKQDELGQALFPAHGALSANRVAIAIARRILEARPDERLQARLAGIEAREHRGGETPALVRLPYFCAGCPHNTSTRVPEGSVARAGIGCHFMAQWMDRATDRFTQMGGEGASWIGEGRFSTRPHVFQNIGDGTYTHSGSLAVRAAVAAGADMTFKVLYNDAVAMTGGQKPEGGLTVPMITRQLEAEGVGRIAVVTDEPDKYPLAAGFAHGVKIHHRDELDEVQRAFRDIPGVSAIVYDQTCAAEKRRRRKRGAYPDPARRVLINELVCEGCGDCGVQSNCVAIVPVETEFGRKRAIDQSACNKDFSCLKGFCPSFVTVLGGELRKGRGGVDTSGLGDLPEPALPSLDRPYGILIGGVGGTGVVTIGALLGMAAHLEGKGAAILDMIGLAQKGGAVVTHLKIAQDPDAVGASRIAAGDGRLILGCDLVVAAGTPALATVRPGVTQAVVDAAEVMTGAFTRAPDMDFPGAALRRSIERAVGPERAHLVDATRLATALLGDSIATNLFLLGYAWQKGLVPLGAAAILQAIELNGIAVELNRRAFQLGRHAAHDPDAIAALVAPARATPQAQTLDELIRHRAAFLEAYQDRAYADRYREVVERVRAAEAARVPGETAFASAVARSLFKLMAYKDEYEVARLYTDGSFARQLEATFAGTPRLKVHLAPPLLASRDPRTGELQKRAYGPWVFPLFRLLARLKRLRGTAFDPFGHTAERRMERRLIGEFESLVTLLLRDLRPDNHALAVEIAALPERIRGFGHVKERNRMAVAERRAELLEAYRNPGAVKAAAE